MKDSSVILWLAVGLIGGSFLVYVLMKELMPAPAMTIMDISRDSEGRITGVVEKKQ